MKMKESPFMPPRPVENPWIKPTSEEIDRARAILASVGINPASDDKRFKPTTPQSKPAAWYNR